MASVIQQQLGHVIQARLDTLPVRHGTGEKPVELRAVIVLPQVAKLMSEHVVDALAWSLYQERIDGNGSTSAATAPTRLHLLQVERGNLLRPGQVLGYDA